MGKSYGHLTAELLTSPDVNRSSRPVLHSGHVPVAGSSSALSDCNLKKVIPGYTGRYRTLTQQEVNTVTEHLMGSDFIQLQANYRVTL